MEQPGSLKNAVPKKNQGPRSWQLQKVEQLNDL